MTRQTPSIGVLWPWIRFVPTRSSNNRSCNGWQSTNESRNRWGPVDRCQVFQNEHYHPRSALLRSVPFSPFGMHATLDSAMCPQIQISQQYLTTSCHADQECAQTKKKKRDRAQGLFDGFIKIQILLNGDTHLSWELWGLFKESSQLSTAWFFFLILPWKNTVCLVKPQQVLQEKVAF